ncbi:hypothetical protein FP2506_03029 [Fulvimarina pelagi HTCC2506]|uniref:Uncharacterized protein n=1 Tax=Fulvimarina pelagi HTCC2506 TaxID=314231 RepID=Q0G0C7_9HYPH|nr:hypothetical protein FP2506_03029 [Fulvimarina pelagi HTCC2506]
MGGKNSNETRIGCEVGRGFNIFSDLRFFAGARLMNLVYG